MTNARRHHEQTRSYSRGLKARQVTYNALGLRQMAYCVWGLRKEASAKGKRGRDTIFVISNVRLVLLRELLAHVCNVSKFRFLKNLLCRLASLKNFTNFS